MGQRVLTILLVVLGISVARLIFTTTIMAPGPQKSEVIVAGRKLEIGTLVKDTDLRSAPWIGPVPRGLVLDKADVVGRGVVSTIYEGEPIRLAVVGAGQGPEQ
jgi:Flp pilus assembly protein CpaB